MTKEQAKKLAYDSMVDVDDIDEAHGLLCDLIDDIYADFEKDEADT